MNVFARIREDHWYAYVQASTFDNVGDLIDSCQHSPSVMHADPKAARFHEEMVYARWGIHVAKTVAIAILAASQFPSLLYTIPAYSPMRGNHDEKSRPGPGSPLGALLPSLRPFSHSNGPNRLPQPT